MEYAALHGIIWSKGTFWVAVAVLIFLGLAGRKIVGAIVKMLDDRSLEIRRQIDEATRLRAEAEAALKDAGTRKNAALAQTREMLVAASRDAERLAAKLISDAHAVAKRREQMVTEQIAAARNAALEEIQRQAAALACRATEIVLRQMIDVDQGKRLIDSAIADLPEAL
ncbi:MAG: ATP synthase F0 subunit B [Alphaproteobacteria bacterium]|nr:ATP synthase F0 subunit B [Alphaproteobacteria bacterium]